MRSKREVRASGEPAEVELYRSHDHLQAIRDEAPSFNQAWLKNGESMPLIQRVGFTVFSLMFCLCGFWLVAGAVQSFREENVTWIFFALASVVFLYVGALGLRNVLRFKRS
jgi:predicted cobalt transporter CbtA